MKSISIPLKIIDKISRYMNLLLIKSNVYYWWSIFLVF